MKENECERTEIEKEPERKSWREIERKSWREIERKRLRERDREKVLISVKHICQQTAN